MSSDSTHNEHRSLVEDQDHNLTEIRLRRRGLGRLKLCPNCLSPVRPADSLSGWMLPEEFSCDECHYRGHVFVERVEDSKASAA
jgi:hypothetical protein